MGLKNYCNFCQCFAININAKSGTIGNDCFAFKNFQRLAKETIGKFDERRMKISTVPRCRLRRTDPS